MTSLLVERPAAAPEGAQRPRILSVPESAVSFAAGDEAVELAAMAGLVLDPWQRFALRQALAEDGRGRWAAFEVGLVVPRQNGKGTILEARELAGLFLLGEQLIIHSAHEFATSLEHFRRVLSLIEGTPDFDRRVKRVSRSHGDEGIELKNGQRLRFKTRTKSGGRGLSGDCVVLDEAMILDDAAVNALMPTMAAKSVHGNPQIWYTGSAGGPDSTVLARVRRRGLAGGAGSLCYMEHSVDEAVYRADPDAVAVDPEQIAVANPGLSYRMSLEHALREQQSMDRVGYAAERLGVGQWPVDLDGEGPFPKGAWTACADEGSQIDGRVALALDVTPDRSYASIGAAGARSDDIAHVELVEHRRGTGWVTSWFTDERKTKYGPVTIDPAGPAGSLLPDLEAAGVQVELVTAREHAQACGAIFDAVRDGKIRHIGQPELNDAVLVATKRPLGDAWAWNRKGDGVISPLVAVTLALRALGQPVDVSASVW